MSTAILTPLSLLYLCGLAALVCVAYSRRHFHLYTACKAAVSVGFVVLACAARLLHGADGPFFAGLLPCLLLCLAGDVFLGLANTRAAFFSRWFLAGAASFTLAHAGFCALFLLCAPGGPRFVWYMAALPAAALLLTAGCARHERFKLRRMHLAGPAFLYAACVGLMCACALFFSAARGFDRRGLLAAAGALLFLISDAVLLFVYFYTKPRRVMRGVNLITYYAGLLLLALSV